MSVKVVIKEPCKAPEIKVIENNLDTFRKIVGGHIECCYPTGIDGAGDFIKRSIIDD